MDFSYARARLIHQIVVAIILKLMWCFKVMNSSKIAFRAGDSCHRMQNLEINFVRNLFDGIILTSNLLRTIEFIVDTIAYIL